MKELNYWHVVAGVASLVREHVISMSRAFEILGVDLLEGREIFRELLRREEEEQKRIRREEEF